MISAMTAFLVLLAVLVVTELTAGVRILRRDRPLAPPASRPGWGTDSLPSRPYSLRT